MPCGSNHIFVVVSAHCSCGLRAKYRRKCGSYIFHFAKIGGVLKRAHRDAEFHMRANSGHVVEVRVL